MNGSRVRFTVVVLLVAGCFRRDPVPLPPTTATVRVQEAISAPGAATARPVNPISSPAALLEAPEPYIDLEMIDAPVKLVLQKLAELGRLQLIISPNLNKKISVQYAHVPVSVALKDVLSRSGLRLGTGQASALPFDTVTVFYLLPANVDSMSAEAIMTRFGVSRRMAELIVSSRRP